MSLAKLTSVSTQTLSLLLERQRLQTLPSFAPAAGAPQNPLHLPQITRNLAQLRTGILALEAADGRTPAVGLLRDQFARMRAMLGADADAAVASLDEPAAPPAPASPPPPLPQKDEPHFAPYMDDPEAGPEPGIMLQTQRQMMDEQDEHLDQLSRSIGRTHHVSLQINDELDVHAGLLEELDTDLDRTESRLSGARRRLETVAKGAKNNGSTVTIILLILVLLVLIIVFKT